ncbi:hypothetical protein EYF80_052169 [Liparis tanakae]|uniref:Uncharacterized protein n=1 Tax=Liparis tanakae TaxID=230148 RepID=A0A4Z2F926_9TELE|nr:hypothetical protein EYF80_052169 [Liparis tanakae]
MKLHITASMQHEGRSAYSEHQKNVQRRAKSPPPCMTAARRSSIPKPQQTIGYNSSCTFYSP